jgi:serine/threonine-protein kinase
VQLIGRVAMEHPPEVLAEKSRDLARALGYTAKPMGVAHGFGYDPDYLQYVERIDKSPGRWEHRLGNMQPPAILFWYRQSPRPLVPEAFPLGTVDPGDPPPIVSGMVSVMLDPQGRLLEFDAVPPQVDKESGTVPPPDWKRLFDAAGLDMSRFSAATPQWTPLGICDARAAWTGVLSSGPPNPVRVEAAAWRGKPIYFQIVGPWTRPERMQSFMLTASIKAVAITVLVLTGLLLVAAALLARHNIRRERGDRRGALRLASFTACVFMLIWVFGGSHVASLGELLLFFGALSCALLLAASVWILYMAIEPIARRRWPHSMISWNRLLAGGVRDPLVGRDVLVGLTFGTAAALVAKLHELVLLRFGATPSIAVHPGSLLGVTGAVAAFLTLIPNCVVQALVWFVLIFILRVVLRRDWLAAGVFVLMYVALNALTATASPALAALFSAVETALLVFTMLRFGLVALIASFFVYVLLLMFPITADFSVWYAGASLFALLSVAAMAALAFRSSLGGTGFRL